MTQDPTKKGSIYMNISIREIEYILAVASLGSISKAAQKMYISQPSLSQTVSKIETSLGYPLFYRTKSGISLTSSGRIFVKHGREILDTVNLLETELRSSSGQENLLVGIPLYLGSYILPPALSKFRFLYPNAEITLTELSSKALEDELLQKKIDLAIFPLPIQSNGIYHELLCSSRMCLLVAADSPYMQYTYQKFSSDKQFIDLNRLRNAPFVSLHEGQRLNTVSQIIFHFVGINPPTVFTTRNFNTLKHMVASGAGVAIVPEQYITEEDRTLLKLACLHLEEEQNYHWDIVAAYNESSRVSEFAQQFVSVVQSYFARELL